MRCFWEWTENSTNDTDILCNLFDTFFLSLKLEPFSDIVPSIEKLLFQFINKKFGYWIISKNNPFDFHYSINFLAKTKYHPNYFFNFQIFKREIKNKHSKKTSLLSVISRFRFC